MKETTWKKYEEIDGLPNSISVEVSVEDNVQFTSFDVNRLAQLYYLENDSDDNPVRGEQSCKSIERAIDFLFEKEEWTQKDVHRMLAWKLGKINHRECEKQNKDKEIAQEFIFHNGWSNDNNESYYRMQLPNSSVIEGEDFNSLAKKVCDLHKSYYRKEIGSEGVWEELVGFASDEKYNGLGTVYLVTLLYFITNKDKPIYDRFAMAALVVKELEEKGILIHNDAVIRGCSSLPSKKEAKGKKLLTEINQYKQYCALLKKHFPNDGWKGRDVDRALWVYGHYFKVP